MVPPLTIKVPPLSTKVPSPVIRVPQLTVRVLLPTVKVSYPAVKMQLILQCQGQKMLSLQDVLMVEAIDLNIWIFMLAPRWTPTVVVCDNNLE
jgi:hypothetical protein